MHIEGRGWREMRAPIINEQAHLTRSDASQVLAKAITHAAANRRRSEPGVMEKRSVPAISIAVAHELLSQRLDLENALPSPRSILWGSCALDGVAA